WQWRALGSARAGRNPWPVATYRRRGPGPDLRGGGSATGMATPGGVAMAPDRGMGVAGRVSAVDQPRGAGLRRGRVPDRSPPGLHHQRAVWLGWERGD